ncbi:MAG: type II toxin-antitoxin system RelE/ParE family toxin [Anaerolineae bacterium]
MTDRLPPWTIEFYTDRRGRCEVVEFIQGLPERERAKIRDALRLLAEFGTGLGMPLTRPIGGHRGLWELRAGAIRLFYVAHAGHRFVLLHAYRKKSQKTPHQEIAAAERKRADFMERQR